MAFKYHLLLPLLLLCCKPALEPKQLVDEELIQIFEQFELMGLSVGLIANGELAYSGSFGLAHESLKRPMSADTYLRIASISKLFTSLAVMQLWEKNLVKLDTPASVYLGWDLTHPKFPDQPITLRHLIDHRSGISDGTGYGNLIGDMFNEKTYIRDLFMPDSTYYTEDMFSDHAPGSYFSYTNCTWGLVGSIIERVSNMKFDQYCRKNIFEPLGLKSSYNALDIPIDDWAALYRFSEDDWVPQVDDYSSEPPTDRAYDGYEIGSNGLLYAPQGGLRTSLNDLWVMAQMFFQGGQLDGVSIIKPTTLAYFQQDKWVYNGENGDTWSDFWLSYTKGMHFITNRADKDIIFPDRTFWGHPGIAYGLLSDFYIDPETKSGIIFITNGSKNGYAEAVNSSFYQVEQSVFQALFPYLKALEQE